MEHPFTSNYNQAPGAFGNISRQENYEFTKQKSYLEWNHTNVKNPIDYKLYDRVDKYDITKEN
jgi:hypothetical protein